MDLRMSWHFPFAFARFFGVAAARGLPAATALCVAAEARIVARTRARAIAKHVAHELGEPLGTRVGYHIGQQRAGSDCQLLFVTAGILLEQLRTGGLAALEPYRVVVLDEVHEAAPTAIPSRPQHSARPMSRSSSSRSSRCRS